MYTELCDARPPPTPFFFFAWVEPALTEEQCLSLETGFFVLPSGPFFLPQFLY